MKAKLNLDALQPELAALLAPVSVNMAEMLAMATQGHYHAATACLDVVYARLPELRRALEDEAKGKPCEPDACYICIGPHVWGKGTTPDEAVTNCAKAAYGKGLTEYDLYRCHRDASVNDMGSISYPEGTVIQQIANQRTPRRSK